MPAPKPPVFRRRVDGGSTLRRADDQVEVTQDPQLMRDRWPGISMHIHALARPSG